MLKGTALRRMVMSLLETGRHPMTVFMMSLWTRNPTPCSYLSSFPLKKTLCPSSVVVSPKFFYLISQSPKIFHLYLSISCISSWSFFAVVSVLVFQVPMEGWRIHNDRNVCHIKIEMIKNVNQIFNKNKNITQRLITVQPVRRVNTTKLYIPGSITPLLEHRTDLSLYSCNTCLRGFDQTGKLP